MLMQWHFFLAHVVYLLKHKAEVRQKEQQRQPQKQAHAVSAC